MATNNQSRERLPKLKLSKKLADDIARMELDPEIVDLAKTASGAISELIERHKAAPQGGGLGHSTGPFLKPK